MTDENQKQVRAIQAVQAVHDGSARRIRDGDIRAGQRPPARALGIHGMDQRCGAVGARQAGLVGDCIRNAVRVGGNSTQSFGG